LADGTVMRGIGVGAEGMRAGELCFNTAMTGYEEILTDPSYAGQIVTFTTPHIGNVGANDEDALVARARAFEGLVGADLAQQVSTGAAHGWDGTPWVWPAGYGTAVGEGKPVVAIDYGAKNNILRCLVAAGCAVTVLPATATVDEIKATGARGLFLSNGPGDPAATAAYAAPMIRGVIESTDMAVFGICLGHQMLGLALGGQTVKMNHGHHGANHPVKDLETGRVEITSMNHGFAVDAQTLPPGVRETHVSLFDGSNCGLKMEGRNAFSVQYHPEASPGPRDSFHLFKRFADAIV
jgi:carbamoyl-phosphate synthase small subunit